MSFKKRKLHIGNYPYSKQIGAPAVKDILKVTPEQRKKWSKVKVVPGNVIVRGKCSFQGYSLITGKLETIREAYCKLQEIHSDARHIVCAYRIPGRNFAALQDCVDDDEHSAGDTLLSLLCDAQIFNRAVFVVRYYGGEHLGPGRFQAFTEAVQSAITHDPYNHITKGNTDTMA